MKTSFCIWQRLLVLCLVCILPFTGLVFYLIASGLSKDIKFAQKELIGNQYQAVLRVLLEKIGDWEIRYAEGTVGPAPDWIISDLATLDRAHAEWGNILDFTPQGLAQRKRSGADPVGLRMAWSKVSQLSGKAASEQGRVATGLVRTMITHSGDTSNLILDPDLDSYYLMDITLLALPEMQDRLVQLQLFLEEAFKAKRLDAETVRQVAGFRILLEKIDLPRIDAAQETALAEDPRFYDGLPEMQAVLPLAYQALEKEMRFLTNLLRQWEASPESVTRREIASAIKSARNESFVFGTKASDFLSQLLQRRIDVISAKANGSLLLTLALVCVISLAATGVTITITRPLDQVVAALEAMASGDKAGRLNTEGPKELSRLAKAVNQTMDDMSRALDEVRAREWLRTGLTELDDLLRGDRSSSAVAHIVLNYLVEKLHVHVGTLYLLEEGRLRLAAHHAVADHTKVPAEIPVGLGLVGQVASSLRPIAVKNVPENGLRVNSSLCDTPPLLLRIEPLLRQDELAGVLEFGMLKDISSREQDLLDLCRGPAAVALLSALARERVSLLLDQTRSQAEELRAQQEELTQSNEELAEHTRALERKQNGLAQKTKT